GRRSLGRDIVWKLQQVDILRRADMATDEGARGDGFYPGTIRPDRIGVEDRGRTTIESCQIAEKGCARTRQGKAHGARIHDLPRRDRRSLIAVEGGTAPPPGCRVHIAVPGPLHTFRSHDLAVVEPYVIMQRKGI